MAGQQGLYAFERQVPDQTRLIRTGCHNARPIAGYRDAVRVGAGLKDAGQSPAADVPQPSGGVGRGGNDAGAVGRKLRRAEILGVAPSTYSVRPVMASQTRAVRPLLAVTTRSPSTE